VVTVLAIDTPPPAHMIDVTLPPSQRVPNGVESNPTINAGGFTFFLSGVADNFTTWGENVWDRDKELREFWPTESTLASAFCSQIGRYSAFPYSLEGPERMTSIYESVFESCENGEGFIAMMVKVATDLFCLYATTAISLGGSRLGQTKTIRDIVKDRDPGPVLSVDENGKIVERNINQWHKTPLGNRQWYWLTTKLVKRDGEGLFLTEDHPMLTDRGWLQAKDITSEMKIATSDFVPSKQQSQLLIGTLLGDASIFKVKTRCGLNFTHCEEQEEWLNLKQHALTGFQWTGRNHGQQRIGSINSNGCINVHSKVSAGLNAYHTSFYPAGGKKIVPRDLIEENFSPLMMAAWYLDDGTYQSGSAMLCTDNFASDDVKWLAEFLNSKELTCTVRSPNYRPRIQFTMAATRTLVQMIGAYVPPSMRYKVSSIAPLYNPYLWNLEPPSVFYDEVQECRPRPAYTGRTIAKTTFHIGVEGTRNFIASGLASHNTQDNGAFIELIRTADAPTAPVVSMRHKDASRCRRTGNWDTPVIYWDLMGNPHAMKWYHIIPLSEMPSPDESKRGLQYCVLTRVLKAAQIMKAMQQYIHEEISGLKIHELHFIGGFNQEILDATMAQKLATAKATGRQVYTDPVLLAALLPDGRVTHESIKLSSLPPDFDLDKFMKWYIENISLAWEDEYSSFAPLPGGNLGTAQQSDTMADKARAKGPAMFMRLMEHKFNFYGVLPKSVKMKYGEQDPIADKQRVELFWRFSQILKLLVDSKIITPGIGQLLLRDAGYLKLEYLKLLGQTDPTPQAVNSDRPQAGAA
jgi:hypothetical protein